MGRLEKGRKRNRQTSTAIAAYEWFNQPSGMERQNNMGNFNWFTDQELAGLKPPYPAMIDAARGKLGQPIRLTFTVTGQHCGHSAHFIGAAADLGTGHLAQGFARDAYQWGLVKALYESGFRRIEICPLHVHADIGDQIQPDGTYPAPVLIIGAEG